MDARVSWALAQPLASSTKFVLVVLALRADSATHHAAISVPGLCDATSQDRKTVLANLRRLQEMTLIRDTGARAGQTGRVTVWELTL